MGCTFSPEERDLIKLEDGRRGRLPTLDCRKRSTKVMDIILENVRLITEVLTSEQVDRCMLMLKEHQLFNGLAEEELRAVCEGMVWMEGNKN